jgi:L-aspartate oxidase
MHGDTALRPVDADVVDGRVRADVAIIGAGAAGLYAAARLPGHLRTLVVDKATPSQASGSSPWAQGGIAAAVTADDSPAAHVADTLAASDGLADPAAAWALANEAPGHVMALLEHGATFDRTGDDPDAGLAPALEAGQRFARSVRRGDASGAELIRVLRRMAAPKVTRLTGTVERLVTRTDGRVVGAWVLAGEEWVAVEATVTILATGGCGGLFAATTNPVHATGDGLALAAGVGARLRDLEFVQFHPTALAIGDGHRFLLTEALRGAGATLHDAEGRRFMPDVHPHAELAPRHVVAGAILELAGATAWLDATGIGPDRLAEEFPTVVAGAAAHGIDLATERAPVTPAAHYHMGGVWTDLAGRTSRQGLLAAGEAACTGLHGANRMAGNSLSEALVFGARAAESAAADCAAADDARGRR